MVDLQGRGHRTRGAHQEHIGIDHSEEMRRRLMAAGLPVVVQIRLPIASAFASPDGAMIQRKAILSVLRVALARDACGYVDDGFESRSGKLTLALNPILRDGAADRIGCIAAVIECLEAMDLLKAATVGYRWHTDWHVVHPTESVGQWSPFSYRDIGELDAEAGPEMADVCQIASSR